MTTAERWAAATGVLVLALAWFGPMPVLAGSSFTAHMILHMSVVVVAAPLIGAGLAGLARDRGAAHLAAVVAVPASVLELVAVWFWHTPRFHEAARWEPAVFVAEQATFAFVGIVLWGSALAARHVRVQLPGAIFALLMTSMHMTLLGVILALAGRPLFSDRCLGGVFFADPMIDQAVGGVLMLGVGGAAYLAGGLFLAWTLLTQRPPLADPSTA